MDSGAGSGASSPLARSLHPWKSGLRSRKTKWNQHFFFRTRILGASFRGRKVIFGFLTPDSNMPHNFRGEFDVVYYGDQIKSNNIMLAEAGAVAFQ